MLPGGQQTSQGSTWLSLMILMFRPLEACCFTSNSHGLQKKCTGRQCSAPCRHYLHFFQPHVSFFPFESVFLQPFLFFSRRSNITAKYVPFQPQYRTRNFVSKYGTILFFKGRLATMSVNNVISLNQFNHY